MGWGGAIDKALGIYTKWNDKKGERILKKINELKDKKYKLIYELNKMRIFKDKFDALHYADLVKSKRVLEKQISSLESRR